MFDASKNWGRGDRTPALPLLGMASNPVQIVFRKPQGGRCVACPTGDWRTRANGGKSIADYAVPDDGLDGINGIGVKGGAAMPQKFLQGDVHAKGRTVRTV